MYKYCVLLCSINYNYIFYIDCVNNKTTVQEDRHGCTSSIQQQHRKDLEEDHLSDNCQEVDRPGGDVVITASSLPNEAFPAMCNSPEQVKKEKHEEPEKDEVNKVFGTNIVCFRYFANEKEIIKTTFFNLPLPRKVFLTSI